ncbi:hypothetical protein PFISCL1PPCAC_24174, partial [Pristionchus fissidentatus]
DCVHKGETSMAPELKKPVKARTGKSRSIGSAEKVEGRETKKSKKENKSSKEKRSVKEKKDKSGRTPKRSAKELAKEEEKKKVDKREEKKETPKAKTEKPAPAKRELRKKASTPQAPIKTPTKAEPKKKEEDKFEKLPKAEEEEAENENSGESQLIKFDLKEEAKQEPKAASPAEPKVDYNKLKDTVNKFLENLKAKTWARVQKEFEMGYKKEPKDKQKDLNPDTRYKIAYNVPPDSDFYDASKIEIPGIENKFILAAEPAPDKKHQEDFWRMVYDSNVTNIFYLENYDDEAKTVFVPWTVGAGQDFGKMFISNKKIDSSTKFAVQTVLEVLPEGCSNSIIVRFMQCRKWPETLVASESESMHALCFFRLLKDDKGATMIICKNGLGRSAMFLMAHSICTQFNSNIVVEVPDILSKIRAARWGSIQEEEQYLTLHMIVFKYIQQKFRKHLADECDKQKNGLAEHLEKIE